MYNSPAKSASSREPGVTLAEDKIEATWKSQVRPFFGKDKCDACGGFEIRRQTVRRMDSFQAKTLPKGAQTDFSPHGEGLSRPLAHHQQQRVFTRLPNPGLFDWFPFILKAAFSKIPKQYH